MSLDTPPVPNTFKLEGNKATCITSASKFYFILGKRPLDSSIRWRVRVNKMKSWMAFGVCYKEDLHKNNYEYVEKVNHATIVISSNDLIWNCNNLSQNGKKAKFKVKTGDIVSMSYNPAKESVLCLNNHYSVELNSVSKKNNLTLVPCFILVEKDDEIEILN